MFYTKKYSHFFENLTSSDRHQTCIWMFLKKLSTKVKTFSDWWHYGSCQMELNCLHTKKLLLFEKKYVWFWWHWVQHMLRKTNSITPSSFFHFCHQKSCGILPKMMFFPHAGDLFIAIGIAFYKCACVCACMRASMHVHVCIYIYTHVTVYKVHKLAVHKEL